MPVRTKRLPDDGAPPVRADLQEHTRSINLAAEGPASLAAHGILADRLRAVWRQVERSASTGRRQVSGVHQARVASRRALAALDAFSDLLPPRPTRKTKKSLNRIRRASGKARDLDVLAQLAREWGRRSGQAEQAGIVQACVAKPRNRINRQLRKLARIGRRRRFKARVAKLLHGIRWRKAGAESDFATLAKSKLAEPAAKFFAISGENLSAESSLHRLRIAAKKLRYALELFAPALSAGFAAEAHAWVKELQAQLGDINDFATAAERIARWQKSRKFSKHDAALGQFAHYCRDELSASRCRFDQLWSAELISQWQGRFHRQLSSTAGAAIRA